MIEDLSLWNRRVTAWPLLPTPKRPVQVQHHVAEDVAYEQRAEKVVAEELDDASFCNDEKGNM